jgi:hypothetical protein
MPHFHSFSLPLIKLIKESDENYFWLIRLHPAQKYMTISKPLIDFLSSQLNGLQNVDWQKTSNMSLPALLLNTDLHLTFDSSVTSDAATFGIKTGLICPIPKPNDYLLGYYSEEFDNGLAKFVPNDKKSIEEFIYNSIQ